MANVFPVLKTIDGYKVEYFAMPPRVALQMAAKITKMLGEPAALAVDSLKGIASKMQAGKGQNLSFADLDMPPDMFARIAKLICERMHEDEVVSMIETIVSPAYVHIQGAGDNGTRPVRFDTDFSGRILLLLKVFTGALEANYWDFFSGKSGGLTALK